MFYRAHCACFGKVRALFVHFSARSRTLRFAQYGIEVIFVEMAGIEPASARLGHAVLPNVEPKSSPHSV